MAPVLFPKIFKFENEFGRAKQWLTTFIMPKNNKFEIKLSFNLYAQNWSTHFNIKQYACKHSYLTRIPWLDKGLSSW